MPVRVKAGYLSPSFLKTDRTTGQCTIHRAPPCAGLNRCDINSSYVPSEIGLIPSGYRFVIGDEVFEISI